VFEIAASRRYTSSLIRAMSWGSLAWWARELWIDSLEDESVELEQSSRMYDVINKNAMLTYGG
jgi:hypothetical protein